MKTMYIKPEIFISESQVESHICAGSGVKATNFGGHGQNQYSNSLWDNEGWGSTEDIVIAGNDNGTLDSQTNGDGLWEDED